MNLKWDSVNMGQKNELELELILINETNCKRDGFDCENSSLNEFLYTDAYYEFVCNKSNTRLIFMNKVVVGYFTVRAFTVEVVEYGTKETYASVYIRALCVDKLYQRKGIGTKALTFIIHDFEKTNKFIGCRFLVIDALPEKVDWYITKGFIPFDNDCLNPDVVPMYIDYRDNQRYEKYFKEDV